MSITKERFVELMHNTLKQRKICKTDRDKIIKLAIIKLAIIDEDESGFYSFDETIEREESLTRDFLAEQKKAKAVPMESDEQIQFVTWFRANFKPEQAIIYANANGGHRDIRTAVTLKKEGVLAGVADLTILWANGKTTWVEMKRVKGGVQSDEQKRFESFVTARGDSYLLCRGFDDARKQINQEQS